MNTWYAFIRRLQTFVGLESSTTLLLKFIYGSQYMPTNNRVLKYTQSNTQTPNTCPIPELRTEIQYVNTQLLLYFKQYIPNTNDPNIKYAHKQRRKVNTATNANTDGMPPNVGVSPKLPPLCVVLRVRLCGSHTLQ